MIIAHASPIGQEIIKLTSQAAAMAVSVLAFANTGGRIFWGWVSDRIGRFKTVVMMFLLGAVVMLVLPTISGLAAFYPSITADTFGPKNLGMNYGVMFTAFGVAAFVGPRLAATVKEAHQGDYAYAFLIAAASSLVGIILTVFLIFKNTRVSRATA
jgi:OFA family oxalate/formate antiporter-like MFS transporter